MKEEREKERLHRRGGDRFWVATRLRRMLERTRPRSPSLMLSPSPPQFHHIPLYLEWAPGGVFSAAPSTPGTVPPPALDSPGFLFPKGCVLFFCCTEQSFDVSSVS